MGRYPQKGDGQGRLFNIQRLINCFPPVIATELKQGLQFSRYERISWVSPLEGDDYAEYRDQDFIHQVTDTLKGFLAKIGSPMGCPGTNESGQDFLGRG
ncbi:MAG: hypothetical protein ACOX57_04420 [Limnochordia bacterium]|jgi:hypothetical protein|nr:hypothetical protein [Bacillota bacterium]